jgi:hypothetical protein
VDDALPGALQGASYIESEELESGYTVPPRWAAYVRCVAEAIVLVRSGRASRRLTLETLSALGKHYFDYNDKPSHFVVRCVLEAFANATRAIEVVR